MTPYPPSPDPLDPMEGTCSHGRYADEGCDECECAGDAEPCDRCGGEGLLEYIDAPDTWGEDCPSEVNHLITCPACAGKGVPSHG